MVSIVIYQKVKNYLKTQAGIVILNTLILFSYGASLKVALKAEEQGRLPALLLQIP